MSARLGMGMVRARRVELVQELGGRAVPRVQHILKAGRARHGTPVPGTGPSRARHDPFAKPMSYHWRGFSEIFPSFDVFNEYGNSI